MEANEILSHIDHTLLKAVSDKEQYNETVQRGCRI